MVESPRQLKAFYKMNSKFTIGDVFKVFVAIILLMVLSAMLLPDLGDKIVGGFDFVWIYMIQTVVILGPLLLVMKSKNLKLRDLGFRRIGIARMFGMTFLAYVAYIAAMILVMQLLWVFNLELPGLGQQESHMELMGHESLWAAMVVIIITFLAPVIEEVFFRGFVFKAMMGTWPKWLAFFVSAVIFAAFHFEFQIFVPLLFLGLILNFLFFKSKSLYPGLVFHIINNVIALGLEYFSSIG